MATVHSRFEYTVDDAMLTRSEVKLNNKGQEDHFTFGLIQKFGLVNSQLSYNVHNFNYIDREDAYNEFMFAVNIGLLNLKYRVQPVQTISSFSVPFNLFAAEADLTFDQTRLAHSDEVINSYKFQSKNDLLTMTAYLQDNNENSLTDIATEYHPFDCCHLKYSYRDTGIELHRKFSSTFQINDYRIVGEINSYQGEEITDHVVSAITFEKVTQLSALKMRLEYDGYLNEPALKFELQSRALF